MSEDDLYADRKKLTFEHAEGAEPLPSQMQLKEVSPQLRAVLWRVGRSPTTRKPHDNSGRMGGAHFENLFGGGVLMADPLLGRAT